MIRWMGAILVIGACGCCGWSMAGHYSRLERCLLELRRGLELMCCHLEYGQTPLLELCRILGSACSKEIGRLFFRFGEVLQRQEGDISLSMAQVLAADPSLPASCAGVLRRLSRAMGETDPHAQLQAIRLELEQLKGELEMVSREKPGRMKCYRALGICGGLALALILL